MAIPCPANIVQGGRRGLFYLGVLDPKILKKPLGVPTVLQPFVPSPRKFSGGIPMKKSDFSSGTPTPRNFPQISDMQHYVLS